MTTPTPLDLREITRADVYIDNDLAGSITRTSNDTISFDYIGAENVSLPRVRDHSVSWSLFRTADQHPVITTGGAVAPFFAGLLPKESDSALSCPLQRRRQTTP
jgi:serine/threonine-protein kinase HipA